ncbi:Sulfite exporter TauE/SafE [Alkalispirochaeta americana]|uniref:Probable membrane transporter protein n=1 Tax=Alkalispirochaeta americana TaxID=159291 RepID=A0A1N6REU4_9SPIO|nr:sulfite exporter TauE/SafE family protein [Alkalispirochaeta americana]SIQ27363.1 Sulfite exporter TauE/SafE [Alkalispirochaeta americana]
MNVEYTLGLISFLTSFVAAVIGFGGGMLLIAILPVFLSPGLIIPVHGITQLASNSSRLLFSFTHVRWTLLPRFLAGSLAGALVFGYFLSNIPIRYLPVAIGSYILLTLWSRRFSSLAGKYENYYVIGFIQTGLGLVVGSAGPLSLSLLTKKLKTKDEIIATSSMFLTISHFAKIPVYSAIATGLTSALGITTAMVIGSILGSFAGTRARLQVSNDTVLGVIKILLTLLSLHMISRALPFPWS